MKILIADDHTVVREGIKRMLSRIESISMLSEAKNGIETLKKIQEQEYDLVILDISMPDISGLDILSTLKDKKIKSHILILSVHPQEHYAIRALKLGASGYLSKDSVYEEFDVAIKTILAGKRYIVSSLAESIIFSKENGLEKAPHEKLSEREFQIMIMLAKGHGVKEIADELFISDNTVSTHRMRILEKMQMKKNTELMNYAIRNDLIE